MAFFLGVLVLPCPLCSRPFADDDEIFQTSGTWEEAGDLEEYCDVAMHRRCFDQWPDAERFGRSEFASTVRTHTKYAGLGKPVAYATDDVLVLVLYNSKEREVLIKTAWPMASWRIPFEDWDQHREPPTSALATAERRIAELWPEVRSALPTIDSILAIVEPSLALTERIDRMEQAHNDARRRAFMEQADAFAKRLESDGVSCEKCGAHSCEHSFTVDSEGNRASFFVCVSCHRSTTLDAPIPAFNRLAVLTQLQGSSGNAQSR
jgi:hypothetical protein